MTPTELTAAKNRLAGLAHSRGVTPPETILAADGGPSDALMRFCVSQAVSLDWALLGGGTEGSSKATQDIGNDERAMTRQAMQDEAGCIEALLDASQALYNARPMGNALNFLDLIEAAGERAKHLTSALDSVSFGKGGAA